jgi:hypothetical protein
MFIALSQPSSTPVKAQMSAISATPYILHTAPTFCTLLVIELALPVIQAKRIHA